MSYSIYKDNKAIIMHARKEVFTIERDGIPSEEWKKLSEAVCSGRHCVTSSNTFILVDGRHIGITKGKTCYMFGTNIKPEVFKEAFRLLAEN